MATIDQGDGVSSSPDASLGELAERAPSREILIRPRMLLSVVGTLLLIAAAFWLLQRAWPVISWMLMALLFAIALNPAVEFFVRRGIGRGLSVAIVCVLAAAAVALAGWLFIPPLIDQTTRLVEAVPGAVHDLTRGRGPLGFLERHYHVVERVKQALRGSGASGVLGYTSPVFSFVQGVLQAVLAVVTIFFLTVFMLLEGPRWVAVLLDLVPARVRPRWERAASGIYRTVGGYVTGNLLISVIAGVCAFLILLGTGVSFAVPLAVLVAVTDLIPLVGATIGTVVLVLVALGERGVVTALIVLGALIAYQQVENHLLQPLIYGRTVRLSALIVLVAVLLGGSIAGLLGALIAIPVAGALQVILNEILDARRTRTLALPNGVSQAPAGGVPRDDSAPGRGG